MLLTSSYSSHAQLINCYCPQGYSQDIAPFYYYGEDDQICLGWQCFCIKLTGTYPDNEYDVILNDIIFDQNCPPDTDPNKLERTHESALAGVLDYLSNYAMGIIPPCEDPAWGRDYIITNIYNLSCRKWLHENGSDEIRLTVCDDNTVQCEKKFKVCTDNSSGTPVIQYTCICSLIGSTPNCALDIPTFPPDGVDPDDDWETECFRNPDDCTLENPQPIEP